MRRLRDRGRLLERQARRPAHELSCGDAHDSRERARGETEHLVAWLEARHSGAGDVDDPGEVDAGDLVPRATQAGREANEVRGAPDDMDVACEYGSGADAYADLAWSGLRTGELLQRRTPGGPYRR